VTQTATQSAAIRLNELDRRAPNPFIPVQPAPAKDGSGNRLAQRERRARILAATRVLIARGGLEKVTVREIAGLSGISIQTIYNLAGNRIRVVEMAISEHISTAARPALSQGSYPNLFFALADQMWINAVQNPHYTRWASMICSGGEATLNRRVYRHQGKVLAELLQRHYGGRGGTTADFETLACHVTTLTGAIALDWARGSIDSVEFRYRLATGYGFLLQGLDMDEEIAKAKSWYGDLRTGKSRLPV